MFARVPFRQPSGKAATGSPVAPRIAGPFRPLFDAPCTTTVVSEHFADLARIYEDDVNLCLIQRARPREIEGFVDAALRQCADIEIARIADPNRFDFAELWPQMQLLPGYRAWLADVAMLTQAFCELFGRDEAGLRIQTLSKAMCPRFHVDRVPVRLICSYGGIGTEWLPEHALDRSKLGLGAKGQPDDVSGLITDRTAIRGMPAYAVGLMKGENWVGNENRGLVHRSPAPTALQPRRLILTLDMP